MLGFPPRSLAAEDAGTPRVEPLPLILPRLVIGVSIVAMWPDLVLLLVALFVRNTRKRGMCCCCSGVVLDVSRINTLRDGMQTKERVLLETNKAREAKDTMYQVLPLPMTSNNPCGCRWR